MATSIVSEALRNYEKNSGKKEIIENEIENNERTLNHEPVQQL